MTGRRKRRAEDVQFVPQLQPSNVVANDASSPSVHHDPSTIPDTIAPSVASEQQEQSKPQPIQKMDVNVSAPWKEFDCIDSNKVVRKLVASFKYKFEDAYPTWKKVPQNVRDLWFEEFKKYCTWDPEMEPYVKLTFERKGKKRLTDTLYEARTTGRPSWMLEEVYNKYTQYWESEEFKKISTKNKSNKNMDRDGLGPSKHTSGSISFSLTKKRLENKLNREITPLELHDYAHSLKNARIEPSAPSAIGDEGEENIADRPNITVWSFVDERARIVSVRGHELYDKVYNEAVANTEDSGSSRPPTINHTSIWLETVGGIRNGHVYGLGSFGHTLTQAFSTRIFRAWSNSQNHSTHCMKMIGQLKTQVTTLTEQLQKASEDKEELMTAFNKSNQVKEELMNAISRSNQDKEDLMVAFNKSNQEKKELMVALKEFMQLNSGRHGSSGSSCSRFR